MELSNVKLTRSNIPLERISVEDPLTGTVPLVHLKSRGLRSKPINRMLKMFSFTNEHEGYVAEQVGKNQYRITGHWTFADDTVHQPRYQKGIGFGTTEENIIYPKPTPAESTYAGRQKRADYISSHA